VNIAAASLLAKSGEAMKSGPIGLAVILILCIACYFLFKSMSKHLKTVREDFPDATPAPPADVDVDGDGAPEPADAPRGADDPADHSAADHSAADHSAAGHSGAGPSAAQPTGPAADRPSPEV
jgi:hypothetical protein